MFKNEGKSKTFEIIIRPKINSSAIDELIFSKIKKTVLGNNYELCLVIIGKDEIKKINKSYRNIGEPTDILSFPLTEKEGEILICPEIARKEAPNFGRSYDNFIKFLFIHGLIHLKGFEHGDKMESEEKKVRDIFGI